MHRSLPFPPVAAEERMQPRVKARRATSIRASALYRLPLLPPSDLHEILLTVPACFLNALADPFQRGQIYGALQLLVQVVLKTKHFAVFRMALRKTDITVSSARPGHGLIPELFAHIRRPSFPKRRDFRVDSSRCVSIPAFGNDFRRGPTENADDNGESGQPANLSNLKCRSIARH